MALTRRVRGYFTVNAVYKLLNYIQCTYLVAAVTIRAYIVTDNNC